MTYCNLLFDGYRQLRLRPRWVGAFHQRKIAHFCINYFLEFSQAKKNFPSLCNDARCFFGVFIVVLHNKRLRAFASAFGGYREEHRACDYGAAGELVERRYFADDERRQRGGEDYFHRAYHARERGGDAAQRGEEQAVAHKRGERRGVLHVEEYTRRHVREVGPSFGAGAYRGEHERAQEVRVE